MFQHWAKADPIFGPNSLAWPWLVHTIAFFCVDQQLYMRFWLLRLQVKLQRVLQFLTHKIEFSRDITAVDSHQRHTANLTEHQTHL